MMALFGCKCDTIGYAQIMTPSTTTTIPPAPITTAATAAQLYLSEHLCPHVGYWRQSLDAVTTLPWPGDHCDPNMPEEERERVAALLRSHPVTDTYRGMSWDRLGPLDVPLDVGSGEIAARGYVWPEGLAHYVLTYGLVLPSEFLAAIA
jgi:hypothetical protein